jgi:hypothetical protein
MAEITHGIEEPIKIIGYADDTTHKHERVSVVKLQKTMDQIDYELYAIRRGASNDKFQVEIFRILNEKYEHHSKIYTDGSKKKTKRSDTQ